MSAMHLTVISLLTLLACGDGPDGQRPTSVESSDGNEDGALAVPGIDAVFCAKL